VNSCNPMSWFAVIECIRRCASNAIAASAAMAGLLLAMPALALNVQLDLVTHGIPSDAGSGRSYAASAKISGDGRYVLFQSRAANLLSNGTDFNNVDDVFLYDQVNGTTTLVSHAAGSASTAANGASQPVAISSDGRWALFQSSASNLANGVLDGNQVADVFLFDRDSGVVTLISRTTASVVAGNGESNALSISSDGSWILFRSKSTDLIPGGIDTNADWDIYLYDRVGATTRLASHAHNDANMAGMAGTGTALLSADGQWVAFSSAATDLVGPTATTGYNVFLYDRVAGNTILVSRSLGSANVAANGSSLVSALGGDGRWVLFNSIGTDLVGGVSDNNNALDVFVFDRITATTQLVSHSASDNAVTGNDESSASAISDDGRWIYFHTDASNIAVGDLGGLLVFDRNSGSSTVVVRLEKQAPMPTGWALSGTMSRDGRWITYYSNFPNVVGVASDTNVDEDIFLFDRLNETTTLVSHSSGLPSSTANAESTSPRAISNDGQTIVFGSVATNLVAGVNDTGGVEDVFVFNRGNAINTLVTRALGQASPITANQRQSPQFLGAISGDGRWVLYSSEATNVITGVQDRLYYSPDVFLRDRVTGTTSLISHAGNAPMTTASGDSYVAAISTDGRWSLFTSNAGNLINGTTEPGPGDNDAFLHDRQTGATTLVSHASGSASAAGNAFSNARAMSADGRWILFESRATDLVAGATDSNMSPDVFLFDRTLTATTLVSHSSNSSAATAFGPSTAHAVSADGRWALYESLATDVVAGITDTNAAADIFLFDRDSGDTILVSRSTLPASTANAVSSTPVMSADGRWVAFVSRATDLVGATVDTNNGEDVFLFDRLSGSNVLVSHAAASASIAGNQRSFNPKLERNGRWLLYASRASDVVAGITDLNAVDDVILYDRMDQISTLVSRAHDAATTPDGQSYPASISDDGHYIAFDSEATDVVVDAGAGNRNAYVFDRHDDTYTLLSRVPAPAPWLPSISSYAMSATPDGQHVLLFSNAPNLIAGVTDVNDYVDIFVARTMLFADGFEESEALQER
jgi:hypothetical protein